ncbi:MAG: FUSC family protein [Actinomycetota bacterium]|nr:FUSC family protein [Actinomycetota bacterium]
MRRGLLAGIPVGAAFLVDLEAEFRAAGAISIGALLAGFVAFDAQGRTRFAWQILTAPVIGAAAAVGALTLDPVWLAAVAMGVVASTAALALAVSPRLFVAAMACVLALLLAQGLAPSRDIAADAMLLGAAGAALQALFSLATVPLDPTEYRAPHLDDLRSAESAIRQDVRRHELAVRHALRWGLALAVAVVAAHVIHLGPHGYWIPLTVLFVLRPQESETVERIAMRAAGTVFGLLVGTPLAIALGGSPAAECVAIAIAAGFSFALLAIEYALFTAAITCLIVLLSHALGESAWSAAGQRAAATFLGLAIVAAVVAIWVAPARRRT